MTDSERPSTHPHTRVVVLDDLDEVRHMLAHALATAGFDVVEAANELELQRVLTDAEPDALLIDLQRSEAEGLRVLTRMRARPRLRDMPILFLAGIEDRWLRQQAMRMGADWFSLRPLGMIELRNRVADLLQRGERHAQQPANRKRVS